MISSASALSISIPSNRPASPGRSAAAEAQSRPGLPTLPETLSSASELQRAVQARDYLAQAVEGDAEGRKVRAEARLEEAKQKLALLKRWGFDPEVVIRGAAQLAREVGSAAREFAAAVSLQGAEFAAGPVGDPSVPPAYRDVIQGSYQMLGMVSGDRETMEAFKTTLQQIGQLLDKSLRELRQQKSRQGDVGAAAIEDALSALRGVATTVSARLTSFSITI